MIATPAHCVVHRVDDLPRTGGQCPGVKEQSVLQVQLPLPREDRYGAPIAVISRVQVQPDNWTIQGQPTITWLLQPGPQSGAPEAEPRRPCSFNYTPHGIV